MLILLYAACLLFAFMICMGSWHLWPVGVWSDRQPSGTQPQPTAAQCSDGGGRAGQHLPATAGGQPAEISESL